MQLVEVTDSAVLCGVAEVVSSNPMVGHKIFSALSPHIYIYIFKRQPFWFHNLNSMVPVKGIVLLNLVFLSHLFFSIHITFGKCKIL